MPCDTLAIAEEQKAEILNTLERLLEKRRVEIEIGRSGSIAFKGWNPRERGGMTDLCSYRKLAQKGSFQLKRAIQRAEVRAGRKLSRKAIAAGTHSHDGGASWNGAD